MEEAIILGAKKAIKMLTESGQIGGVVQQKTIITPEQEYTGTFHPGDISLPNDITFFDLSFVSPAPDKIWVNWDGTTYECDAVHETQEDNGVVISQYLAGTVENMVFGIMTSTAAPNSAVVLVPGDSTTHTIGIYTMQETIRKIDPKFLPGIDALTLNGADGKQYKLVVDASGALAVTPIE